jgi:DtxR family Mn-dependent transcriptional regulator
MLSESVENYLTEILRLEESAEPATTSVLARRLAVARPSVTGMVKRLAADGFILHERYKAVRLTPRGRRAGRAVIRRHRIVETFLVDVLEMSPDSVHEEANRLEHALSEEVIDRLDAWLGRPTRDPHGKPIPGPGGSRRTRRTVARPGLE